MNQTDFQKLYEEYKDKITYDNTIKQEFDMLYSLSQKSNVFLVTVIGSVKAGKSTFFNCLIHKDISNVGSSETTIKPIIVYYSETESYKTYVKKSENQIDINSVLNYLFESNDNDITEQLDIKELPFEEVKKGQDEKNYLFTSFGIDIPIEDTKKQPIVFVDMPGNGGIKAKQNYDPFYDLILRKTDLIILVIDKVIDQSMSTLIESISSNNPEVPFVVIMKSDTSQVADFELKSKLEEELQNNRNELTKAKANVDSKNSAIINAFHVSLKQQGKPITPGFEPIVEKDVEDFTNFENNIAHDYFSKVSINNKLQFNQKKRFPNQIDSFRKLLEGKETELKKEIKEFEDKLIKLTPEKGRKTNINAHVENLTSEEALAKVPEIKQCAQNQEVEYFCRRKVANKILKENYLPNFLQKDLENIFNDYVDTFCEALKNKVNDSEWRDVISNDTKNKKKEYVLPKRKDKIFKKCITPYIWFYGTGRLIRAMKNLKKSYLEYDMTKQIEDACIDIQKRFFQEIKEKEEITDKEKMLSIIQTLLKKLK